MRATPLRGHVVGHRQCICGCARTFAVTCTNRGQKCYERACVTRVRQAATEAMRVQSTRHWRRSKFGTAIALAANAGRIAEDDLLALCAEAYTAGYRAGFQRGRQRRAERQQEAA